MTKCILLRHGRSAWNEQNLFTGWVDIPLSQEGIQESIQAGEKIQDIPISSVFCSQLFRAQMTLAIALLYHRSKKTPVFLHPEEKWSKIHNPAVESSMIPVTLTSALNERMYGKLQGYNKAEMAEQYGKEQIHTWRRSFNSPPPEGESLAMTAERAWPYFQKNILPLLVQGQDIFICAHGNSLRAIIMHLEQLSPEKVIGLELATGEPLIYTFQGHEHDTLFR